jgi:predicted metal-dependent phosphoesterase TrpH
MTPGRLRGVSAVLLATGVVLGTLSDEVPVRVPRQAEGYWMLLGDFHVHAFPGDGGLAPWSLRDEAARAGLDVYAVTNHNRVFTARLARWMTAFSDGPLVLVGQEVTNPTYHMIALGIERPVNADQPAASAIADIHAQGGLAIAAHPSGRYLGYDVAAMRQLDGVEVGHPVGEDQEWRDYVDFFRRAQGIRSPVAPIGSSDFHVTSGLARCYTWVFAREPTAHGVFEAIRQGRTVAVDQVGRLYGDEALVQLAAQAGPLPKVDAHRAWRRLSLAMAWFGVLALLVLRRGW